MTRFTLLVAALSLAFNPIDLEARQHPLEESVDSYLELYLAGEIEDLRERVSPDVVFEDPSMTVLGREAFVTQLVAAFGTFTILGFDERQRIYSGSGHVLVSGELKMTIRTPGGSSPELTLPFAISLKFSGSEVVRHVDFVDALEFDRQMRGLPPREASDTPAVPAGESAPGGHAAVGGR